MYDFSRFLHMLIQEWVNDTAVNTHLLEYVCNKEERLRKEASGD